MLSRSLTIAVLNCLRPQLDTVGPDRLRRFLVVLLHHTQSATYNNQGHEVDPIPEGMSILNVIHDVNPTGKADHLMATTAT
jgi:hypothetical protein